MMVAVGTMYVTVRQFFFTRCTDFQHLNGHTQPFAGVRMIAIQVHRIALDLHDREDPHMTVRCTPFQLTTNLDTRWKLRLGYALKQSLVTVTECIIGRQFQTRLKPNCLALQRCLEFWKQISITAMQISNRLFAVFQYIALDISNLNADCDRRVFFNIHGIPN